MTTMNSGLVIVICVPTDRSFYGDASQCEVDLIGQGLLSKACAYAHKRWPVSSVEGRLVAEGISAGNQTTAVDDDGPRTDVVDAINAFLDAQH